MSSSPDTLRLGADASNLIDGLQKAKEAVFAFSKTFDHLTTAQERADKVTASTAKRLVNEFLATKVAASELVSAVIELNAETPNLTYVLKGAAGATETLTAAFTQGSAGWQLADSQLQRMAISAEKLKGALTNVNVPKIVGRGLTTNAEQLAVDKAKANLEQALQKAGLDYSQIGALAKAPTHLTTENERLAIEAFEKHQEAIGKLRATERSWTDDSIKASRERIAATKKEEDEFNKAAAKFEDDMQRRQRASETESLALDRAAKRRRENAADEIRAAAARDNVAYQTDLRKLQAYNRGAAVFDLFRNAKVPTTATFGEQQAFISAKTNLAKIAQANKLTATEVVDIWRRSDQGRKASNDATTNKVIAGVLKIKAAYAKLGEEARKRSDEEHKQLKTTNQRLGDLIFNWRTVTRILAVHAGYRALALFNQGLRDSVETAKELLISISEIQTIDPDGNSSWQSWYDTLERISNKFGTTLSDTAEAAYESLSNQVVDTREQFELFSGAVARFALATKSSMEDSVNLITASLNAYGYSVAEAERLSAIWFKTIDLGRIRADEFANTIGRILPLANALGISIEEIASALAVMTIRGIKANEAQTYLRNVLLKLLQPTEELKGLYSDLGVANGDIAVRTYGLGGILDEITEKTGGWGSELVKMVSRIRAVQGLIGLTGPQLEAYQDALSKITTAQDEYNRAVELTTGNLGKKFQIELQQISNYFTRVFGFQTLNYIDYFIGGIEKLDEKLRNLVKTALELAKIAAVGFGLRLLTATVLSTIRILEGLRAALFTTSLTATQMWSALAGPGLVVATAVIYAIVRAYEYAAKRYTELFETLRKDREIAFSSITNSYQRQVNVIAEAREAQFKAIEADQQQVLRSIAEVNKRINIAQKEYVSRNKLVVKNFTSYLGDILTDVKSRLSEIEKQANKVQSILDSLDDKLRSRKRTNEDKLFDLNLEQYALNPALQAQLIQRRINQIIQQSTDLVSKPANIDENTLQDLEANEARVSSLYDKLLSLGREAPDSYARLLQITQGIQKANEQFEEAYLAIQKAAAARKIRLADEQKAMEAFVDKVEEAINKLKTEKLDPAKIFGLDTAEDVKKAVGEYKVAIQALRDLRDPGGKLAADDEQIRQSLRDQLKYANEIEDKALEGIRGKELAEEYIRAGEARREIVKKLGEEKELQLQLDAIEQRRRVNISQITQVGRENLQQMREGLEGINLGSDPRDLQARRQQIEEYSRRLDEYEQLLNRVASGDTVNPADLARIRNVITNGLAALTGDDKLQGVGAVYKQHAKDLNELFKSLTDSRKEYEALATAMKNLHSVYDDFNKANDEITRKMESLRQQALKFGLDNPIMVTAMGDLTQELINLRVAIVTRSLGFGIPNVSVPVARAPGNTNVNVTINGAGKNGPEIAREVALAARQGLAPFA